MRQLLIFILALSLWASQSTADPARTTVFSAASLSGVLQDISRAYNGELALSFGGSGRMARQVAAGAPVDLLVLAHPIWLEWLTGQDHISISKTAIIASNSLALIGPAGTQPMVPQDIPERLGDGRLAMGQRNAVPAGSYARDWLQSEDLWQQLQSRLAETDNVRAALALVARQETPLGIVYATDALAEPRVRVLYEVPTTRHAPIHYLAIALSPNGAALLDFLTGRKATEIFAAHGFGAPPNDR